MGVDGHGPEKTAKARLARLLRNWWEQDPGTITQEALARRITGLGVRTSQEMLSRYLHRTRPTLARPDVIRAMHQVLGRAPEELTAALALHAEASAAPAPVADAAVAGPASPGRPAPDVPHGPDLPPAPDVLSAPDVLPGPDALPVPSRPRRWWIAVAAALVVGASALTLAMASGTGDEPDHKQSSAGTASPAFPFPPTPTVTATCHGETCFGIDAKYAVCREDAATYYTGAAHGIRVELRFSPKCQTAWARMSGTSQGDVVRITNNADRSRHYTQQWGHDAHTTMVEALNPDDAKACARTPRGEVCATVPVPPRPSASTAPHATPGTTPGTASRTTPSPPAVR